MTTREGRFERRMEQDWQEFRRRLADRLADMERDDMLFVEVQSGSEADQLDGATPYVQFCGWGAAMVRAEAVSNVYLDSGHGLSAEQEDALVDMGWEPVGLDDEGDPVPGEQNFHVDAPATYADRLAVMTVRALREVYGCVHPAFLDADGLEPEAPTTSSSEDATGSAEEVPLTYPRDRDELQELVDAALEVLFESPAEHDDDGDVPIVCGRSVAFVRVREDRPAIELFAELVLDVADRSAAPDELDRLNRQDVDRQFFLRGDSVVVRHVLVAWPFVPDLVRACTRVFCDDLDEVAAALVERVGGRRFLDPQPEDPRPQPPRRPETSPQMSVALRGLLELMQVGHVPAASVAALFDDERDALVSAIGSVREGAIDPAAEGLEEEVVLDRLRRGLRVVVDRQARTRSRPQRSDQGGAGRPEQTRLDRQRSQQLSLRAEDEPTQEDLWGREVS